MRKGEAEMLISRFEHTQTTYGTAVFMLSKTGKSAVIYPTGTGKSFVRFKLCADNPDATIC
jgi:hypothetical protein